VENEKCTLHKPKNVTSSPSHEARVLISDIVKRRKVIGDDSVYKRILDLGASGINPVVHIISKQAEFVVDDGAVGRVYVLRTGHEDGFISRFIDGILAFFETPETYFPSLSVRFIRVCDEILKAVSEEGRERGNSASKKFEGVGLIGGHACKNVRKGLRAVSMVDAVVNMDEDLRDCGEPKFAVGSGFRRGRI